VGLHCGTSDVSAIIVLIFVDIAVAGAVIAISVASVIAIIIGK
jgi:hypothetical protein